MTIGDEFSASAEQIVEIIEAALSAEEGPIEADLAIFEALKSSTLLSDTALGDQERTLQRIIFGLTDDPPHLTIAESIHRSLSQGGLLRSHS